MADPGFIRRRAPSQRGCANLLFSVADLGFSRWGVNSEAGRKKLLFGPFFLEICKKMKERNWTETAKEGMHPLAPTWIHQLFWPFFLKTALKLGGKLDRGASPLLDPLMDALLQRSRLCSYFMEQKRRYQMSSSFRLNFLFLFSVPKSKHVLISCIRFWSTAKCNCTIAKMLGFLLTHKSCSYYLDWGFFVHFCRIF